MSALLVMVDFLGTARRSMIELLDGDPASSRSRRAKDLLEVKQLQLSETADDGVLGPLRLASEPRAVGNEIRLALALPWSKFDFTSKLRALLLDGLQQACGGGLDMELTSVADKPADFRGGVEFGLMSTTTAKETALYYSGVNNKRGTVFEIDAGRIDVGASIQFLSQYPGEAEFLMQPLSCLEVMGDPRVEQTEKGQIVMVPLRVNVNLKAMTVEDLIARRKMLHLAMVKNLREELHYETAGYDDKSEGSMSRVVELVLCEFERLTDQHREVAASEYNLDETFKHLLTEAIEAKTWAMTKVATYLHVLRAGRSQQDLGRVLDRVLREFASAHVLAELRTGISCFPWRSVGDKAASVDLSDWTPQGMDDAMVTLVAHALAANENLRSVAIGPHGLLLGDGWATKELVWDGQCAVTVSPAAAALVIRCCPALTSLSLRNNGLDDEAIGVLSTSLPLLVHLRKLDLRENPISSNAWEAVLANCRNLTAMDSLNGDDSYSFLRRAASSRVNLGLRELSAKSLALPYSMLLATGASVVTYLNLCSNGLGVSGATSFAGALGELIHLQKLDLRSNNVGQGGAAAVLRALAPHTSLELLWLWHVIKDLRAPLQRLSLGGSSNQLGVVEQAEVPKESGAPQGANGGPACDEVWRLLAELRSLQTLWLGSNGLETDGCLGLAPALTSLRSLRSLNLNFNGVLGHEARRELRATLPWVVDLHVSA